ncbi:hypothetical protein GCL60_02090 [Silvanigrella paludirubra]|uniref:Lipoprotein n=1 Tax=Silvanigrella paludirubra TaxID=2499159 RepID=A0A6N6VVW9_9BACT|nr:hypothetical protein [Silvanigrella paludirubra]KAB8040740.1 hypothetical protein GCL60_02090 [Silvanigrella paludirubra]
MYWNQLIKAFFIMIASFFLWSSCSKQDSVDLMVDIPELLRRDKLASFYGPEAKKHCEHFRKVYAGFCDTVNQPYIKCYDLNDKKYKLTECD